MDIRRVNVLEGPNIWTNYKALEAWVDIGKFEDFPSHKLPGFPERIMAWLPSMIEHRCGIGERGGFFQRLVTGTYLGHILEHVTLELQSLAGVTAGFGRARETSERGVYKVAIEFIEPEVTLLAMQTARTLIMAAVEDEPFDVAAEVAKVRAVADRVCLGAGTGAIVQAASARGIPNIRLNSGSLVQLGYCSAQKRIWTAETDTTSAVAESIAQDKQLTASLLRTVGIPVPEGQTVDSPEAACAFAESEGYPVVIKPVDGNHGRGVSINVRNADAVRVAYELAAREGSAVIVERMVPGIQHRVLVVGSSVVAANRAEPDRVIGDGTHTIAELVDEANKDPRRGSNGVYPLAKLALDEIALNLLKQQELDENSVPASGQAVVLDYNGDYVTEVTDEVHPDVAAQCVLAAQTVGLNIAGIDLIVENINQPLSSQKGAVIEVNASPGLMMHVKPVHGTPRPVGAAIVSNLFEAGATGRVPVIAVTGTNGKTSTVNLLEQMLIAAGRRVGVADSDSIRTNGRTIAAGDSTDFAAARRILVNPFVDSALFEVGATGVLNRGLGFDRCQVAVITNLGSGDHLGAKYVETLEVMTKVKRCPVDVVLPEGTAVLNACDAAIAGLAKHCKGNTLYFSPSIADPAVRELLAAGGRVVTVDRGNVVVVQSERTVPIVPVTSIPHTMQGRLQFQIENALAAIAAAHALGISTNQILDGLARAAKEARPRFRCFDLRGAHVVLSMCRNPSALNATILAIESLFKPAVRKAMYGTFADHSVDAAREQGAALGNYFDEVTCGGIGSAGTDEQPPVDELAMAVHAARGTAVVQIPGEPCTNSRLQSSITSLEAGQLLLVQALDSRHLATLSSLLSDSGGHELVNWPASRLLSSLSSSESKGRGTQSNDV
jgi:cyanophycin synthetase